MKLLNDQETLLASNVNYLLGTWLEASKKWGTTPEEKRLNEFNARWYLSIKLSDRNQITLWGPNGEIVDYASKAWSGVYKDYYIPRFVSFVGNSELPDGNCLQGQLEKRFKSMTFATV